MVAINSDTPDHFSERLELQSELKHLITESIICNTDVRIEPNNTTYTYEPMGQELEVGMIKFLIDNN
jgi:hypothetical protein